MATILPFRRKPAPAADKPPDEPPQLTVNGIIEIRATDEGDQIKVNGAYTDRVHHGAFVALQLLNMFANKIAASDGIGYSSSEPVKTVVVPPAKKKRGLPAGFLETTEMGDLEPPPPRRRRR